MGLKDEWFAKADEEFELLVQVDRKELAKMAIDDWGETMHDWTMIGMEFGWREGVMKLHFLDRTSQMVEVVCSDVSEFQMSRRLDWGESVSVNRVEMVEAKGSMKLRIEIQSGDQIILVCGNVVGILGKESRQ